MIYRNNTPAINLANANECASILSKIFQCAYHVVELEPGAYKVTSRI